jgi:hypothetical protein
MTETNFRWQSFLDHLAGKAELATQEAEVFKYQFDPQQEHQSQKSIAESFDKKNHRQNGTYNSTIKRVYNKLKLTDLGIDFETAAADKSDVVWQWLKREYPQWEEKLLGRSTLGIDALWSQLKGLGKYAPERMGISIADNNIDKANAFPTDDRPKPFLDKVAKNTKGLKFKISSENMGQVLLLNNGEMNEVYCFCPSEFAPSINLHRGEKILPERESKYPYLGAATLGRVEWWGWIVKEMPPLSWLEAAFQASRTEDMALRLNAEQLAELLSQVKLQQGEVLHTFYRVV